MKTGAVIKWSFARTQNRQRTSLILFPPFLLMMNLLINTTNEKSAQDIRVRNRRIKEQAKTPIAKCKMKYANFKMSDPENFAI
jgi:hypothetical protein